MIKKTITLLIALLLVVLLCSCNLFPDKKGDETKSVESTTTKQTEDETTFEDDPIVGDGTSYSSFIEVMRQIKEFGDKTSEYGLKATAEYYYSFAGASVSSFRYAVEYILWLRGEGDSFVDFTADSRFKGFDVIAEINYSSPYPCYFAGLMYEVQGKYEECVEPYAMASIMPMFPEEGLDFYYLKFMSIEGLYELRDKLRTMEEDIYNSFIPVLTGHEWDRKLFDEDYLLGLSANSIKESDYESALFYAEQALKTNPFRVEIWQNAAACAMYAEQLGLMGEYVEEGLAVFPEDSNLLTLKQALVDALDNMEVG